MRTVIKGAQYYDNDNDQVLIPHFTGELCVVDCTRYITKKEIKDTYDENWIEDNEGNIIEHEGTVYYYAEYSPQNVGDWDLISDISDLEFCEEDN